MVRAAALVLGTLVLLPPTAGVLADRGAGQPVLFSTAGLAIGAAALSVGLFRRNAMLLLPGMFGGAFGSTLTASELVRQSLLTGSRATIWMGVCLVYFAVVLRLVGHRSVTQPPVESLGTQIGHRMVAVHRVRTATAAALLLGPATALWSQRPDVLATGSDAQARLIFPFLLAYFLWTVLFYLFFVAPDLGSDLDARHQTGQPEFGHLGRSLIFAAAAVLLGFAGSGVIL